MQPIVIIALWILWFLSWLAGAMLDPRSRKLPVVVSVGYDLVMLVGGFTLLFGFLPDPGFDIRNMVWPTQDGALGWVLVAVVGIAFCFTWIARFHIGFALPDSKNHHPQFVETGPYRLLRQPIYLALILAAFATAASTGRPSAFGAAGLLTIAFVVKILIEEHALRDTSPGYDDYADRVHMLLPIPSRQHEPVAQARIVAPPARSGFHGPIAPAAPVAVSPAVVTPQAIEPDPIEEILEARRPAVEPIDVLAAVAEPETAEPLAEIAAAVEPETVEPSAPIAEATEPEAIAPVAQSEKPVNEPRPGSITTRAVQLTLALDDPDEKPATEPAFPVEAKP